ncbi:MAG TPA: hypothetical protein VGG20_30415, partial [Thermoanaerobaculia bacterium]
YPFMRHLQSLIVGMSLGIALNFHPPALAQCTSLLQDGDFEDQRSDGRLRGPWIAEGRAGIDFHLALSHRGENNAWASNKSGWNAIRQAVHLSAGVPYTVSVFIRTSGNVKDGYFGFRDAAQHPVSETKFGPLPKYGELRVKFRPTRDGTYNVFAGFWAPNQDAWIRVDEVRLDAPCNDTAAVPADG